MAARLARVARQESRQMRLDADRPHARSAAAVRDAEGLVQVEVADVRAELAGPCKPHLRVQVRAVQIDLPARLVDDVADLGHLRRPDERRGGKACVRTRRDWWSPCHLKKKNNE